MSRREMLGRIVEGERLDAVPGVGGWKTQVQAIIGANAGKRVDGNVASFRTRDQAAVVIFAAFKTLHDKLGYRLQNPRNLSERHVKALVEHWHRNNRAANTMRQNLSILRKFAAWIGKPNLVKSLPEYLPDVNPADLATTSVLRTSKSWSENGIDVDSKIAEADALNEKFGLMLRIEIAFGVRGKEVLMLKPWKADHGHALMIFANSGPKNGRSRPIPITTVYQREVLDYVKARTPKTHHIGWYYTRRGKAASLQYNLCEYQRCMQKIGITRRIAGVTGHGLRAEYAENQQLIRGLVPPTLGGKGDELPREEINLIRAQISENLGHSRTSVTSSYYGSFKGLSKVRKAPEEIESPRRALVPTLRPVAEEAHNVVQTPDARRKDAARRREVRRSSGRDDGLQAALPVSSNIVLFRAKPRERK